MAMLCRRHAYDRPTYDLEEVSMFKSKAVNEAFAVAIARITEGYRVKVGKAQGFWIVEFV